MKRFLSFLAFLIGIGALIALGALLGQVAMLTAQVSELTARVQKIEEAGSVTIAPTPSDTATRLPTATDKPSPTLTTTPTRTPTIKSDDSSTPRPTETLTPTPAPTRTPTRAPTATNTPVPTPFFIVNSDWVNVRTGPGREYPIIDAVPKGDRFDIGARNPSGTWLEFCCVKGQQGWIYSPLLDVSVDVSTIQVAENIPLPPTPTSTPVPPTATPTSAAQPPPTNGGGSGLGVRIEPENRCSPYDSDDYRYPQSVEPQIVAQQGGRIYGPYTGRYFPSTDETDIEHIVARSEAHDSGLCGADIGIRRAFARDLLNLTLASPSVNRHQKVARDVAEWLPAMNQCWYVNQVVLVKRKYNLSMDQAEATRAQQVLAACSSTEMQFTDSGAGSAASPPVAAPPPTASEGNCSNDPLGCWDDNGNGRITCAEARRHGIAPVPRGHPAYQFMRDGDNDGVVCE